MTGERVFSIVFYVVCAHMFGLMAYMKYDMGQFWLGIGYSGMCLLLFWAATRRAFYG